LLTCAGPYSIWYLYSERRYGWSSSKNGFFLAEYGLASVLAQGVLLPRLTPRFMTEGAVVAGSFLTNVALFAAYGALRSRDSSLLFAILPLSLMGTLSEPVLRQVFSQLVASEDQGAMQGALSSLSTLANASGPMIAAGLFSWGVHAPCGWEAAFFGGCANLVGAPFFASSFLFLLAFVTSQSAFADDGTTRPRPDEASPLLVRKLADHTDAP
jgi:DHA1 family tetracycline resistance protein-like MFS transporter